MTQDIALLSYSQKIWNRDFVAHRLLGSAILDYIVKSLRFAFSVILAEARIQ